VTKHGLFDENGKYATTLGGQDIFNMNEIMLIFDKLRSEYRISKIEIQVSNNSTTPMQHGTPSDKMGGNVWVRYFDDSNSSNWVYLPEVLTKAKDGKDLVLNYVVYNCLTRIADSETPRRALGIKKRSLIEAVALKAFARIR
jgi:hypothetical protein